MNKLLNHQIFTDNTVQKKIREEELARERIADKQMIDSMVERERILGQLEAEAREKYKQETKDFLKNYKNRSNELALDQDYLDKLLAQERDKQWQKRQNVWDKEEKARVDLMYDVYGNRANALAYLKQQQLEEQRAKELEKQTVTQQINQYQQEVKRADLEEILVSQSPYFRK